MADADISLLFKRLGDILYSLSYWSHFLFNNNKNAQYYYYKHKKQKKDYIKQNGNYIKELSSQHVSFLIHFLNSFFFWSTGEISVTRALHVSFYSKGTTTVSFLLHSPFFAGHYSFFDHSKKSLFCKLFVTSPKSCCGSVPGHTGAKLPC